MSKIMPAFIVVRVFHPFLVNHCLTGIHSCTCGVGEGPCAKAEMGGGGGVIEGGNATSATVSGMGD